MCCFLHKCTSGTGPRARARAAVRISMRNVFGRDVQEVGTRTRLAWSPGSLVLFR